MDGMKTDSMRLSTQSLLVTRQPTWRIPTLLIIAICVLAVPAVYSVLTSPMFAFIASNGRPPVPADEIHWASVDIAKPMIAPIDAGVFAVPLIDSAASPPGNTASHPASDFGESAPTNPPDESATETPGTLVMEIVDDAAIGQSAGTDNTQDQHSTEGKDERWIDVNLSEQRVYAYEGDTLVNSLLASTGLTNTPTVTGSFNIWIKVPIQDMFGPGYYLPDVPYVMYFYEDYGLHGTYWHNNFGAPMSRGCVNLTINDAAWLFDWASVGTVVNVHY